MHCGSNRAASENAVRRSAHSHFPARSRAAHSDALAAIRANQVCERNRVRPPRTHEWYAQAAEAAKKAEKEATAKHIADVVAKHKAEPDLDLLGDLSYKTMVQFPATYVPSKPCVDVLKSLVDLMKATVPQMPHVIEESVRKSRDCLMRYKSADALSPEQALAVVAYTFDLRPGFMSEDETGYGLDNFYYQLNNILRERSAMSPQTMMLLKPYMYYVITGLRRLPKLSALTGYRGIPSTCVDLVRDKYVPGTVVHWSGFTSVSKSLGVARQFAGPEGVIFRVQIHDGRCVKDFSFLPNEDEILLSPNSKFLVTASLVADPDGMGFLFVDLSQILADYVF